MAKTGGQAGVLTYNAATIYFSSVGLKYDKKLADSTDTGSYDVASGLLWPTQVHVSTKVTIDFEGFFYTDTTDPNVIADLCAAVAPRAATVKVDATHIAGHGNVDAMNVEVMIPADDVCKVKGSLVSSGTWTHGS